MQAGFFMRNIVILGSTGSIGRQALEVVRYLPDRFKVVGLAAGRNLSLLAGQIKEFRPDAAVLAEEGLLPVLRNDLACAHLPELAWGKKGLEDLAALPQADLVLVAVTGAVGIYPTIAAVKAGKAIALANKETLVAAGELVMDLVAGGNVSILPVDSEHSAIWQCLHGHQVSQVNRLILTASGGPFRGLTSEELAEVTVDMALAHPNWQMGRKITVDSATLMNKGLEIIEAKWLFGVEYKQITVVIHPQSIVHSAVEFTDGSVVAQLGAPDMRLPIHYALNYPERVGSCSPNLDLTKLKELTFEAPDPVRFPSLSLAFSAGAAGGTMPAALNAANEVAVAAFLAGRLSFTGIPDIAAKVMDQHKTVHNPELEEIMAADKWARECANKAIHNA